MYHFTALVTCLAIAFYFSLSVRVSKARAKFGVKLPAISGHPDFERVFRVHMNTLERDEVRLIRFGIPKSVRL
jgi:hypothetical protein